MSWGLGGEVRSLLVQDCMLGGGWDCREMRAGPGVSWNVGLWGCGKRRGFCGCVWFGVGVLGEAGWGGGGGGGCWGGMGGQGDVPVGKKTW